MLVLPVVVSLPVRFPRLTRAKGLMCKRSNQYTRDPWAWMFCLRTHLAIEQVPGRYCTYTFSTPGGSKLNLFSLYRQWFPRCRSILKIGQSFQSCTYIPFLPNGVEIELISRYRQWLLADFQNCHIFGHETWPLVKVSQIAHILPKLLPPPPVRNFTLFCSTAGNFQYISNFAFSYWAQC